MQRAFYELKMSDKYDSNEIENLLSVIESISAPIHRRILGGAYPSPGEKEDYSYFLATLYARTSNHVQMYKKTMNESANLNKNLWVDDREAFQRSIESLAQTDSSFKNLNVEELRQGIRSGRLEVNPDLAIFFGVIDMAINICPVLYSMHWSILRATGDLAFVTSDNPVCLFDAGFDSNSNMAPAFRSSPTVQITCPLSQRVALLATWSSVLFPKEAAATNQDVKEINRRTVMNSERFVLASENSVAIQSFVNRTTPSVPDTDVHYDAQTDQIILQSSRRR